MSGLGARDGGPVACNWTGAISLSQLLPWLAILGLLALKPNRHRSAWWIWVPLLCLSAASDCLQLGLERQRTGVPKEIFNTIFCVPVALAFGLAAIWLLAPYLARGQRFRTFLRLLLPLAAFNAFTFAVTAGWEEGTEQTKLKLLALLALLTLVVAAAMVLCGLTCRGRYRPILLFLGLFVSLLVVCLAVLAPFGVVEMVTSPGGVQLSEFFLCALGIAAMSFTVLLPFIILSLANALFRERLKALFHLERQAPPPLLAPDTRPSWSPGASRKGVLCGSDCDLRG